MFSNFGSINSSNNNSNNDSENHESVSHDAPSSSNQFLLNNIRFGMPVCILRAPEVSNLPPEKTDENLSEQQSPLPSKSDQPVGGRFCDKFPLHVISVEDNNLYTNRVSYNTQQNAYYENGILSNKYINGWNNGTFRWDNIELKREYDWLQTYLARNPSESKMNDDGEISWKFDYRMGGFVINSLHIRLSFGTFDNSARVNWFITPLPTTKNPCPNWQQIPFDPYTEPRHYVNEVRDFTRYVKDEYGFILRAHLSGGDKTYVIWQKTQLFRQDFITGMTLDPDIIVDPLPELEPTSEKRSFVLNDEATSDFVIHLEVPTSDEQKSASSDVSNVDVKDFHIHSKILSARSDYFNALLASNMIESQNKSLKLAYISHESLERILNYLYTGTIPDIQTFDEWTALLHGASRFLIPALIQRCEKALKGYVNHDNLREVEDIAKNCGAEQLVQYCKMFEPRNN
ncbi:3672_t:CDS:2 [Funneliformis caledonium]|uniref:3672_t:CDS:1 n=1 Tax=Funneliformis caledonium TaxID=1117310 RepID=A0A9N9B7M8_9GLOM|nr:3672_t:CDS:2 [Funneliformis caledonium]